MAFRALLSSKSSETNAAITAACKRAGIRAEVCSDIFSAIEKGKTQAFSCVIADWADQPEASFLLRRARESEANRHTVAVAIVDHEPPAAEIRDNRLDFLIYRPIAAEDAYAVLGKACEQMQPSNVSSAEEWSEEADASSGSTGPTTTAAEPEQGESGHPSSGPETDAAEANGGENATSATEYQDGPQGRSLAPGLRVALAAVFVLAAAVCLWRSRSTIEYLSQTPEGRFHVLRESVAALFYANNTAAFPVGSAGAEAQQDAYFSRDPVNPDGQKPSLGVAATESTLTETHIPLAKASDFPLPLPEVEHQDPAPVRRARAAIPDSMKTSPPIAPPVVVTVNAAQMMPISVPQPAPAMQQASEPVVLTEEAARALLVHTVGPAYPPEALAQKLHGPVVLQVVVGRDGSVEDLKMIRGYFVLGQAAIAAVKQWKFQPYTLNGHPAATQTTITINFSYPAG